MRVLFVSSQFPNAVQPDLGIFSLQIVKEMAKSAELRIIAPVPAVGPLSFLNRFKRYQTDLPVPFREDVAGLHVWHPGYFALPGAAFLHHVAMQRALEPLIGELHREWKIDAVNCHWLFPDGVAVQRICAKLGLPVMLTALGCDLNWYTTMPARKRTICQALAAAQKVSVLNSSMSQRCRALGVPSGRVVVIANGVDLETFSIMDRQACRRSLGLSEGERLVLFVGALVEVKNVENLLRAFRLVLERQREVRLVLVGSGHLREGLVAASQALGISAQVQFAGQVAHDRLAEWMNAADCLCLPSLREGHPNVMMEALSCGTPVVATSAGSVPDFITGENGVMIDDPLDPREIAVKIETCLCRSYDRSRVRGTVREFGWDRCAGKYLAELASLTSSSAA